MASRAQELRAKALKCLHASRQATDPDARAWFLKLAASWRELAEQVEQ